MIVKQYNQSFRVIPESRKDRRLVKQFLSKQHTYKRVQNKHKVTYEEDGKYYSYITYKNEYVFIDSIMKDFFYHIFSNGLKKEKIKVSLRETQTETVKFKMKTDYPLRDEQPFFIDGMCDENRHHRVIVEAVTGYGKTFMAMKAAAKLKRGILLYILPTYIAKWKKDIHTYLDIDESDIYVIKGRESLIDLMDSDEQYKIVIASASTMLNYFKETNNSAVLNTNYKYQPEDFMEKLNLGIFLSDETHQSFNNIFNGVLMLDPKRVIALSATLITKNSSLEKFHKLLFPKESRLGLEAYKKYVIVENVYYTINSYKKIYAKNGGYGYSHKKFEAFILNNRRLRDNYLEMLFHYVDKHYIDRRRSGDKCLIYASSLEMIDFLTDAFKKYYKHLDVRKYIGGSDYSNALDPDIRISHQQSLGAAIDIKNLIYTLNTINIDSISALIQMIGRLRENEIDVIFTQLASTNIPQHRKYIIGNRKYLEPRVKKIIQDTYTKTLHV